MRLVEALLESGTAATGPNARHTADPGAGGKTALMYALVGWSSLNLGAHGELKPGADSSSSSTIPASPISLSKERVLSPRQDHTAVIKMIAEHKHTDATIVADDGGLRYSKKV